MRNKDEKYSRKLKYINADLEFRKTNLYYILTEINMPEKFLFDHAQYFDEVTNQEKNLRRKLIQEKINQIESKGGKTNYQDMQEMYGRVTDLWSMVTETQNLSESFIERYIDKFNNHWNSICRRQKLSEDFIRRHSDKVIWWAIAHFQDYSEKFLLEFFNEIYSAVKHENLKYTPENGFLRIREPKNQELILLLKMRGLM
jgi:hypothetical protein